MHGHLTDLLSTYQDLRDRLGADDPLVLEFRDEISRIEAGVRALPNGERRRNSNPARYMYDGMRQEAGKPLH